MGDSKLQWGRAVSKGNAVDSRQVDCFLTTAQLLNFTKAAKALYLSQSTVTQQVRALEEEMGFRVFNREGGVSLTPAGAALYESLSVLKKRYLEALDNARGIANAQGELLRVGYESLVSEAYVARYVKGFVKARPDVRVHLQRERVQDLTSLLRNGAIAVAFTNSFEVNGVPGLEYSVIERSTPCVFMLPNDPLYEKGGTVVVRQLRGRRLVVESSTGENAGVSRASSVFESIGIDFSDAIVLSDTSAVLASVEAGLGISINSTLAAKYAEAKGLVSMPLDTDVPPFELVVAWNAALKDGPAVQFAEYIRKKETTKGGLDR